MNQPVKLPKLAVLELTYRCNQSCVFCSCPWENTTDARLFYEKKPELTIAEWKDALKVLEKHGAETVSISGGEALLKNGLDELLRYIRAESNLNKDKKIVVITNGASMNEGFLSLFKEMNVHLSVSLPGLTTFGYHIGAHGNTAANALHWLNRAGQESLSTTVNITVTKKNYHELYETIANGLIAGADTILINRFLFGGRGAAHNEELSLSQEELCGVLETAEDILSKAKRKGSVGTEYPLCVVKKTGREFKRLRVGNRCAAVKEFFVVDPSGYIRTCNHSPVRVGYVFEERIISDIDYWKTFADSSYKLPAMCENCKYTDGCDYGCREAAAIFGGSLSAPDPCFLQSGSNLQI